MYGEYRHIIAEIIQADRPARFTIVQIKYKFEADGTVQDVRRQCSERWETSINFTGQKKTTGKL